MIITKKTAINDTIEEFRVLFDLNASHKQWIDDWLSYAVDKKVETLELILIINTSLNNHQPALNNQRRPMSCYNFPYNEGNFPSNLKMLKKLSLHQVNVIERWGRRAVSEKLSLPRASVDFSISRVEIVRTFPTFKCLER